MGSRRDSLNACLPLHTLNLTANEMKALQKEDSTLKAVGEELSQRQEKDSFNETA